MDPGLLQAIDSGATVALAVIAIVKMSAIKEAMEKMASNFQVSMDKMTENVTSLMTQDIDTRTKSALEVGQILGQMSAQLRELVEDSRENRRASGSDTRHKSARREDYPSNGGH